MFSETTPPPSKARQRNNSDKDTHHHHHHRRRHHHHPHNAAGTSLLSSRKLLAAALRRGLTFTNSSMTGSLSVFTPFCGTESDMTAASYGDFLSQENVSSLLFSSLPFATTTPGSARSSSPPLVFPPPR